MEKIIRLGTFANLKIMARPTAVTGFLLLWLILSLVGWWGLDWGA